MCTDLGHIQKSTIGFLAERVPRSTKMECIKILKYLQRESMEALENQEQLVCTIHDFVLQIKS